MSTTKDSFYGLGIAPGLMDALDKLKFTVPTPIQFKAIPIAIEGKDVMGIAQTGTGKTLAFGIPMVQLLAQKRGRGLVIVPTRELALQVNESIAKLTPIYKMKTTVLIGGESMYMQTQSLRNNPRIIIATPGRLIDHVNQRHIRLDDVCILVLDEADRMFDMGFAPQIDRILNLIPSDRQTMLFSATMPASIVKIASSCMRLPIRTEIAPTGTTAEFVTQEMFIVNNDLKGKLLSELLKQYAGSVLLFMRTKIGARRVTRFLKSMGFGIAEIHSDRTQVQRKEALHGFKIGKYRILAATDIAARGIDVKGIELVINYDLPDDVENYIHRIGRTGRAGQKGHAISFATSDQGRDVKNIEKMIKTTIPLSLHPNIPEGRFSSISKPSAPSRYQGRKRYQSSGSRPSSRSGSKDNEIGRAHV